MKLKGKTRLKVAIWTLVANFIVYIIGIIYKADLTSLGVGLATINAPILVYILGETFRPSFSSTSYHAIETKNTKIENEQ